MNKQLNPNDGTVISFKRKSVKRCPQCESGGLVIKTNHDTGVQFLGCLGYPYCKHTEPLPQDILMRQQGAPTLPGLE